MRIISENHHRSEPGLRDESVRSCESVKKAMAVGCVHQKDGDGDGTL